VELERAMTLAKQWCAVYKTTVPEPTDAEAVDRLCTTELLYLGAAMLYMEFAAKQLHATFAWNPETLQELATLEAYEFAVRYYNIPGVRGVTEWVNTVLEGDDVLAM
jgi:hypothetical protein